MRLQVQAESFNAFNCRQYNNPMTNITRVRGYAMGAPRATRRPATELAPALMIALMRLPAKHSGFERAVLGTGAFPPDGRTDMRAAHRNPAGKQNAVFFQRCGRRPGGARIGRDQAFLGSGE